MLMQDAEITSWLALWLPTLTLIAVRLGGMFLIAPVLSESAVPARLRVLMSAVMSLAVVGFVDRPVQMPDNWAGLIMTLAGEALLGAAVGYAAKAIFAAVELAALHVSHQMGLALGELFGGADEQGGASVRRFFHLLAVVLFLAVGGHRVLISAMLDTFRTVPLTGFAPGAGVLEMASAVLSAGFVLALKIAAPVLIAMLLATAAMGVLHRAVPQCNVLSTGLPVRAMLGLLVLGAALAVLPGLVEGGFQLAGRQVSAFLEGVR